MSHNANRNRPLVVAGGGIAGLLAALWLREKEPPTPVILLESSSRPGGLLRAVEKEGFGRFDRGMHTFTTCGIPEVDDYIEGLLPPEEWVVMSGKRRDISGAIFQGQLQTHCHYPDLRLLPAALREKCVADFILSLRADQPPDPANMDEYAVARFGRAAATLVVEPILKKLYARPAREIDPVVAKLLPLDRLALFDEVEFLDMLESPLWRSRIAYPEQRRLPLRFASPRKSLYPKKFGTYRLIDAILRRARAAGVEIITEHPVSRLEAAGGRITAVSCASPVGEVRFDNIEALYWTAGYPSLLRALDIALGKERFEAPKIVGHLSLLCADRPDAGDLYYFWGFDPDFKTFRATAFHNYCEASVRKGGWPVCVEFFLDPEDPLDEASLTELARNELTRLGVLAPDARISCSVGHGAPMGFPILSCENRRLLEAMRNATDERGLTNLSVTGIQSEWGLVFQPDVLAHTWQTVETGHSGGETLGTSMRYEPSPYSELAKS